MFKHSAFSLSARIYNPVKRAYLNKHDNTFAQNFVNGNFIVVVAFKDFLLQKFACGEMESLIGSVKPAAIKPFLSYRGKKNPQDLTSILLISYFILITSIFNLALIYTSLLIGFHTNVLLFS